MLLRTAVLVVLLVGCSGSNGPKDSGIDATVDSGIDAPLDATLDAGRDAGRDGGRDAGPLDPDWVGLPGILDGCQIERAVAPETLARLEWTSCGEGCQRLVPDARWAWGAVADAGGHSEGRTMLLLAGRERREPDGPTVLLLFDVDSSTPLVAMRHQETEDRVVCAVNVMAFGQGHVAFPVIMVDFERGYEETWVFHGSVDEPEELVEPVLRIGNDELPGLGNLLQRSFASATTAAFQVQPLGEMWIVEGGVLARRANRGSAAPGSPQGPQLVGRHLMWMEWEAKVRLAHATFDSPSEIFLDVPDADTLFATDGADLAWLQGYGWDEVAMAYARTEVWTAPYTTEPDALVPRRVRTDYPVLSRRGVVGGGRWVAIDGESVLGLVELSTGRVSRIELPAGMVFSDPPTWVTATEIGIAGRYREEGRFTSTFFRIAIPE
ncbi:MAG: hypothetical protein KC586_18715 [Myxococcales bacterium]|nr:hypothetical protein [Myxococcales bacterium]